SRGRRFHSPEPFVDSEVWESHIPDGGTAPGPKPSRPAAPDRDVAAELGAAGADLEGIAQRRYGRFRLITFPYFFIFRYSAIVFVSSVRLPDGRPCRCRTPYPRSW